MTGFSYVSPSRANGDDLDTAREPLDGRTWMGPDDTRIPRGQAAAPSCREHRKDGGAMADWKREIGAMTLYFPDLGEARKFYADAFGVDVRPLDDNTAMLQFEGIFVFLAQSSTAAQPPPEVLEQARKGAGQFAIIADDVDAVCTEIAARGVRLITGPADRAWGMRTATFADPGGHIWEIAQELPSPDS
jgi:catechol 2,3-dioxygenase-like lactoylglutathione lyase family enzyme